MNWQDELQKKYNNLKKEEKDGVRIETNSGVHNRDNSGRGRNVNLSNLRKEINKDKGGLLMISKEGALKDIDSIVNEGVYTDRETKKPITLTNDLMKLGAIVKVLIIFLNSMRSNQMLPETEKIRLYAERKNRREKKKE